MTVQPEVAELKAMVEADKKSRTARAAEKIAEILTEERCVLDPRMILTAKGIQASVGIVALD